MSPAVILREPGSRLPLAPHAVIQASPFVGADLTSVPFASAYGMVVRLVRLNAFRPGDLAPLLGIRTQRAQDLGALMTFSDARQAKLAEALRLIDVPASWNLSKWFPFVAPSKLMEDGWVFRYCPDCLLSGYHTHLHQMPWFSRCPWHGSVLSTTCGSCGSGVDSRADWAQRQDLRCGCGHALIDDAAAVVGTVAPPPGAAAFLDDYLAWAASERACATLVAPVFGGLPACPLAAAVSLPRRWRPWATPRAPLHGRVWHSAGRAAPGALQALTELEVLRRDRPGFLKLSPPHVHACARVAANLALKLPAETLSDGEMTLYLGGAGIEAPESFAPAKRPLSAQVSSLVPWRTGAGDFLNLTCLHPGAYRPVTALVDVALAGRALADFHGQALSGELDLLLRCCGDLLARGYAEGLRSVLAPHVPALFALGRDRPHLTQPWLLVRRDGGRLMSIRAVWEPLPVGWTREADLIHKEDEANRRRERYGRSGRQKHSK